MSDPIGHIDKVRETPGGITASGGIETGVDFPAALADLLSEDDDS